LPFALAALRREVPHQIFVGIAKDVVAFGTVLGEIECWILKDRYQVGKPFDLLLAIAKLHGIIEVREVGLRKLLVGLR
jgi:hypothetical protein